MGFLDVLAEARDVMATGSYDAAEKAERLLTRFIEECQDSAEKGMALRATADVLFRQGRVHAAIESYREAEKHLSDPAELLKLYSSWAILSDQYGMTDHVAYLTERLDTILCAYGHDDAATVYGHLALARLYARQSENSKAVRVAQTAVRLADSLAVAQAEAYLALSVALEANGRIDDAKNALEEAMVHMREGHCLMYAMAEYGRLALETGDRKTAAQYLLRAVELPDHRDRQVVASVLRTVAQLVRKDPDVAAGIIDRLAAHLGRL